MDTRTLLRSPAFDHVIGWLGGGIARQRSHIPAHVLVRDGVVAVTAAFNHGLLVRVSARTAESDAFAADVELHTVAAALAAGTSLPETSTIIDPLPLAPTHGWALCDTWTCEQTSDIFEVICADMRDTVVRLRGGPNPDGEHPALRSSEPDVAAFDAYTTTLQTPLGGYLTDADDALLVPGALVFCAHKMLLCADGARLYEADGWLCLLAADVELLVPPTHHP